MPALAGRAFAVWLLIIATETVMGTVRVLVFEPRFGSFRSRQAAVVFGVAAILAWTWATFRWLRADTPAQQWAIGIGWLIATISFEVGLGLAQGFPWERITEDYNLARGGLLGFGMVALVSAPRIVSRIRSRTSNVEAR